MASKYQTAELVGVVVEQTNNGQYKPKDHPLTPSSFHSWRIGKHTRGNLQGPGQLFLTENGFTVLLIAVKELSFKDRHQFSPIARFLTSSLSQSQLTPILTAYQA